MPEDSKRATLRVATYNLRGLKDDQAAAAAVVSAISPDVLLLQEVPRHPASRYAISSFARATGMSWSGRTRLLSGTSLMTGPRIEGGRSTDRRLRVGRRENPRSYSVARVRCPGGAVVCVVSVHLSLVGGQRVEHVSTVLRELEDELPGDLPLVIGGDLNEDGEGPAWGLLASRLTEVSDEQLTFPAADPRHRIDAIFAREHSGVSPGDTGLLDRGLVARASDHLPVWVDLDF